MIYKKKGKIEETNFFCVVFFLFFSFLIAFTTQIKRQSSARHSKEFLFGFILFCVVLFHIEAYSELKIGIKYIKSMIRLISFIILFIK